MFTPHDKEIWSSIPIRKEIKRKLNKLLQTGESYNDLVVRLMMKL